MAWWGKLAGGAFGFMFGGPLGALLGATFGHQFDKGLKHRAGDQTVTERTQAAFFTSTFAIMGYVAKVDGHVTAVEIAAARRIMSEMQLDEAQREAAIKLFYAGKKADFDFGGTLEQFRIECHRSTNLVRFFLEIQIMTAMADGVLHDQERSVLVDIAERLHVSRAWFERLLHLAEGFGAGVGGRAEHSSAEKLKEAYALLSLTPEDSDADVKKAYRRLMNQHHPDKLVSRGMPEEMVKIANRKSQEIRQAYDLVRDSRKNPTQ